MNIDVQNPLILLITAATFGLVLTSWLLLVLFWHRRRRRRSDQLESRLRHNYVQNVAHSDDRVLRLWKDGHEATTVVPGQGTREFFLLRRLRVLLRTSGIEMPLASFVLMSLSGILVACALTLSLTQSPLATSAVGIVVLLLIRNHLGKRANRQQAMFETQLAEALELCARSLRAGHPLIGSFRIVAEEMPVPINRCFRNITQLQGLGVSAEQAIKQVAKESESTDINLFAMSVAIQLRSGGNLAEMMQKLSSVIRDRMRLKKRVRVLTAQAQLSRRILTTLPFVLLALLTTINPEYMAPLFDTGEGRLMLALAALILTLGIWVMNKISVVHY